MKTLTVGQCTIADEERRREGDLEAFDEAVERLRNVYEKTARGIRIGSGAKFHLTLTVESFAGDAGSATVGKGPSSPRC